MKKIGNLRKIGNLTLPPLLNAKLIRFGPLWNENLVFSFFFFFNKIFFLLMFYFWSQIEISPYVRQLSTNTFTYLTPPSASVDQNCGSKLWTNETGFSVIGKWMHFWLQNWCDIFFGQPCISKLTLSVESTV